MEKVKEAVKPNPKTIKSVPRNHFDFIKISPPIFTIFTTNQFLSQFEMET
jgi:hypothetical protein